MKKLLLASTVLVAGAGIAAADVTLDGFGRFGLQYYSDPGVGNSKTTIDHRLQFNITGSKETDAGVTFGGKFRIRDNDGGQLGGMLNGTGANQALLFAEYQGFRVEVGNSNTAFDSAGLIWNSEIGLVDSSYGDPQSSFYGYNSSIFAAPGAGDYEGIFASYTMGDFTGRISYVDPAQSIKLPVGTKEEIGVSVDYASGPFAISAAAVQNAASVDGADAYFIGAAYSFGDANVGLNYIRETDKSKTVTLYGSYAMGATTLKAYVAHNNDATNPAGLIGGTTKTTYGIGADYDLGGATLTGSIQRDYVKETYADLGVKFSF